MHPSEPPPKYDEYNTQYNTQYSSATPGYPPQGGAYPPPPAGYAPPPGYTATVQPGFQGQNATVVVQQPFHGPLPGSTFRYGPAPALVVCQHCQATVTTSIDYQSGLMTWLVAGGVCIAGGVCGCCLIPFCMDMCKDVEHSCPNCRKVVGMYKHIR